MNLLGCVRKTPISKSKEMTKFFLGILLSFFLLSLVIIPPLSSLTIQKMLRQKPFFVIFSQEDVNSSLLINMVHLSPVNEIPNVKMPNHWTEVRTYVYNIVNI